MRMFLPFFVSFLITLGAAAPSASIATFAGTGKAGYRGDGGPAHLAELDLPFHCELGKSGQESVLFVTEAGNHCIRRINLKTGVITTVVGTGKKGYTGDGGDARLATINDPHAAVVDDEGNLYIADRLNAAVRRVDAKRGIMTTLAGGVKKDTNGDGGKASEAALREPDDVFLDGKGGLLIADVGDWRIRRVDLKTGTISTFAGIGRQAGKIDRQKVGDGGPASKAVVVGARAVCVDGKGNTFICEREGNSIRKVDAQGTITTYAGTGEKGYSGDGGAATKATFNGPKAIRCDRDGNLLVVDTENHAVRRIDAKSGVITTVAGGKKGDKGDGGDPLKAELDRPHGCIMDASGNLYIADSHNNRVRKVQLTP